MLLVLVVVKSLLSSVFQIVLAMMHPAGVNAQEKIPFAYKVNQISSKIGPTLGSSYSL